MKDNLSEIRKIINPIRKDIINHKVYSMINDLDDLKIFMEYHIFAVWDFMSILKSLQNNLTCTQVPWIPVGDAETRFLINEIVVGEESDIDENGNRISHFELYLKAMNQCGADTSTILNLLDSLKETSNLKDSLDVVDVPQNAKDFVNFTFDIINSKKVYLQSAVFTFGKEDLIPDMFYSIINDLNKKFPDKLSTLKYYLERHIEVDGGHHGDLALKMLSKLCGDNQELWDEATQSIIQSLEKRKHLWDGVYQEIIKRKNV